jgi:hypothetical protein
MVFLSHVGASNGNFTAWFTNSSSNGFDGNDAFQHIRSCLFKTDKHRWMLNAKRTNNTGAYQEKPGTDFYTASLGILLLRTIVYVSASSSESKSSTLLLVLMLL